MTQDSHDEAVEAVAFKQYRRSQIAELRPWLPMDDIALVSISGPDKANGSPKTGDMIARNPKNHTDQWLVTAIYFADNFEPVQSPASPDVRAGNTFYGWFDDADQTKPSQNPPRDAPCPFCGFKISPDDVCTHSLTYAGQYAARSYFYRTHRTCAKADKSGTGMDDFILDMIARNGD